MATRGVEGLVIETHNWGKSVAFWQALGFKLEFESDHNSGQLRHPGGGPFIFLAEVPEGSNAEVRPVLGVDDAGGFDPPTAGTVDQPFTAQHWHVLEMLLRDPDGRRVGVWAPTPADIEAAPGHR
jgi:hypothetical protein